MTVAQKVANWEKFRWTLTAIFIIIFLVMALAG